MSYQRSLPTRRRPLIVGQTAVYHVISRTAFDQFILGDNEKEVFRKMLWKQADFHGVEVLTYCVMSNHFHLLVRVPHMESMSDDVLLERYNRRYGGIYRPFSAAAPEVVKAVLERGGEEATILRNKLQARMANLPVFMRELKQSFGIWYNRTHKNHGTLWAERFKSLIVEDAPEALGAVAAYIDLNPVRAEIVDDPGDYRWCGYGEAIGGSVRAREGLASIFPTGSRLWKIMLPAYRIILFGKGQKAKGGRGKGEGHIPVEVTDGVIEAHGQMPLNEALSHRIRYFSDGMVLGSQAYLDSYFASNRDRFGKKRRSGPRLMRGGDWGNLRVMRDLRDGTE